MSSLPDSLIAQHLEDVVSNDHQSICACQVADMGQTIKFSDILKAATKDPPCRICVVVRQIVEAVVDQKMPDAYNTAVRQDRRAELFNSILVEHEIGSLDLYHKLQPLRKPESFGPTIMIYRDSDGGPGFTVEGRTFPVHSPFGPETNSERGFRSARKWLAECETSHSCGKPKDGKLPLRFPGRLLDLVGDRIRLVQTTGTEGRYAALSHRWGDPSHRRLISTVTTIETHKKDIPWDSIPRTFQDAITICRRLQTRYLWIDTLCILQQHSSLNESQIVQTEEDFAKENSAMADIYRRSWFTISADLSTSMDGGIFTTCSPPKCLPIEVIDDNEEPRTLYAQCYTVPHQYESKDLHTRGWTLQEAVLAPRVLHFGEHDITWRCKEETFCECGFLTDNGNRNSFNAKAINMARITREFPLGEETFLGPREWWALVVKHYTQRKLSKPCDKLPALSGLAQIYSKETSDTYLAGLWKESLVESLCWYNHSGTYDPFGLTSGPTEIPAGRRLREFRAPSWSWASIDLTDGHTCCFWSEGLNELHPLRPGGLRDEPVCTLYNVTCLAKTSDPFGEVREASLEIGVKLISAIVCPRSQGSRQETYPHSWTLNHIQSGGQVMTCIPDCKMEDDKLRLGDRVDCAPMIGSGFDGGIELGCVVLKQEEDGKYKRIGFCVLEYETPEDYPVRPPMDILGDLTQLEPHRIIIV